MTYEELMKMDAGDSNDVDGNEDENDKEVGKCGPSGNGLLIKSYVNKGFLSGNSNECGIC